ncbi:asparagine synthase-related protein [Qaidamihabitans albus]|uniref:asparagine synthase-related protein n=1 Tax=Qaidamihabitans albus TaxID=2795733 RepID=UPI0027DE49A0|nr:asparagine synthase-related protein [Qaidamihabitans albus]
MGGLYTMDPLEVAGGWVNGYDLAPLPAPLPGGPQQALDRLLVRHLVRRPCLVAFSGGRDSSVLLAAAVRVARREGLPLPVPVTLTYPDAPDTAEGDWQDAVLRHLGIGERVLLTVHDEHDPVGPIAGSLLPRHGVVWPPNFAPTWRMLDQARGGTLLTGEGGDELFGLKRITPVTKVLRNRGRVDRRIYPHAVRALAPARARYRAALRNRYRRPWLRDDVEELLARRDASDAAAYALHAGRNTWQFADRRCARRGYETMRALGAELDVEYVQTFAEPGLVASVAAAAGYWGWTGRTATMVRLFADLLPRAVLERRTKAVFTDAVFTEHTREFARRWTGSGVDPELVDPEVLRDNWLSASPHAPSMNLLQQAWLADRS